jgi:hypothetical protein
MFLLLCLFLEPSRGGVFGFGKRLGGNRVLVENRVLKMSTCIWLFGLVEVIRSSERALGCEVLGYFVRGLYITFRNITLHFSAEQLANVYLWLSVLLMFTGCHRN